MNNTNAANGKGKFKPYRNRPGKRQGLLELFSFLLILASVPAFLGGVFSIFVALSAFVLGIIGLFAWTRRHAKLFILLAIAVIAAAIVSIILRGTFHAQCVPFHQYTNQFTNGRLSSTDGADNINGNGAISDRVGNPVDTNRNEYDNSIWCGNDRVVYITNAIIILFAGLALFFAITAMTHRNKTPVAARTTETSQTHTRTEVASAY